MGEHLYTYINPVHDNDVAKACKVIENGGVIAYSTDFNYAFGCDASKSTALERVKNLKPHHPKERPFSLLCSDISMVSEYAIVENAVYRVLKKAWPGPYTVLLPSSKSLPKQLHDKRKIVGIRIPQNPLLLAIIEKLGKPLATTSVPNISAHDSEGNLVDRSPHFGYEVFENFGHALDIVLDLGEEVLGMESTIIDLSEDGVTEIIRLGVGDPDIFQ